MIPKNKLEILRKGNSKAKCDGCGRKVRIRHLVFFKGEFLCNTCKPRIGTSLGVFKPKYTLEKALQKTYEIRGYLGLSGKLQAQFHVPEILIGHKVKLTLVE